jgi:hypothetical protein
MRGEPGGRDALLYGSFGQGLCATDGDWTIMLPTDTTIPIYAYTGGLWPLRHRAHAHGQARVESGHFIPGVELPQWRIPIDHYTRGLRHDDQPALYHIADDPAQTRNRYDDAREQRERMRALTCRLMDEIGASPEHHQSHGTRRQG